MRPNLFIVGASKCGTTSMHRYLGAHPQVFMSPTKEPHRFNDDQNVAPELRVLGDRYEAMFDAVTTETIVGESCPGYLTSRVAAERIHDYQPDAKIVIMLRPPADKINASHLSLLRTGDENIFDLAAALDAEPDRAEGRRIPAGCKRPESLRYRRNVRYVEQVQRYLDRFDRDSIKFILLEDLRRDTPGVFRDVATFLGIDARFTPQLSPQNVTPGHVVKRGPLRTAYQRTRGLRRGLRLIPGLPQLYRAVLRRSGVMRDREMPEALRRRLAEEFADEVDALGELIDRDLSHWHA